MSDKSDDLPIDPRNERDREANEAERRRRAEFVLMLRGQGIRNRRVLSAMERVPREAFVDPDYRELAYADRPLPICCGQTISQPFIVAYMTDQLDVRDTDTVLEVGTGTGYQTAVLALLADHVYSIDRYRTLVENAEQRLAALRITNVTITLGDGYQGLPEEAPFDRIMVTAASPEVPPALEEQLAVGGVMVIPVGPETGIQSLYRVTRTDEGISRKRLIDVRFVPMVPGTAQQL